MDAIGFYIFFAVNWVLMLLPLRILYLFSNVFFFILYYFPSYRRKVVAENLRNSFPEKTEKEIAELEKKFYRHFADLFAETLKLPRMRLRQLKKHISFSNLKLLDDLFEAKRDVIAIVGHYNNWEWLSPFPLFIKHKPITIYKPLSNKYFDRYINKLRTKYGMTLTPMSNVIREILTNRKKNINTITMFIADQTPAKGDIRYWTTFLNQDTPVFLGAEKIAKKFDMAVVFFNIQKVRRGYYNLAVELLFEHSDGLPENLITDTHVKRLEEIIREKPEYWIWTHRRWKYKREQENA
jgi:KDO2-lipid IV(A) lauroyltransferase